MAGRGMRSERPAPSARGCRTAGWTRYSRPGCMNSSPNSLPTTMRSGPPSIPSICCKLLMRICVAHETVYRYDPRGTGAIQTLRLTPRNHAGQYVVNWRIDVSADCRLEPQQDAFGNITHAFSVAGPLSELRLLAEGEVETQNAAGVVRGAVERFPPTLFLRDTPLTHADKAILVYAREFPRPAASNTLATLHELLTRLHQDITFDAEAASGAPSAADAFKAGRGTSQDLAHIFIAVARALGVPARYVAGYFRGEEASVQNE